MTDAGKFILFPFKVILSYFQSNISGVNFPVILNKCILHAVLHNFTGT